MKTLPRTLSADTLEPWVDFFWPGLSPAERPEKICRFQTRVDRGEALYADYPLFFDNHQRPAWFLQLDRPTPTEANLIASSRPPLAMIPPKEFKTTMESLILRLTQAGVTILNFRLPQFAELPMANSLLGDLGFRLRHLRVEFTAPVTSLPDESGTPLTWRCMDQNSELNLEAAAGLLALAGIGDPDFDPEEDCLASLKNYLSDGWLYSGEDAVQFAFFNGEPAGILIAQVNPQSGWARITYMGLVEKFRGRGLGKWLHRHGFAMLRQQKGATYHGGTVADNHRMIKLFHLHGCHELHQMGVWRLDFSIVAPIPP